MWFIAIGYIINFVLLLISNKCLALLINDKCELYILLQNAMASQQWELPSWILSNYNPRFHFKKWVVGKINSKSGSFMFHSLINFSKFNKCLTNFLFYFFSGKTYIISCSKTTFFTIVCGLVLGALHSFKFRSGKRTKCNAACCY